MIFDAYFTPPNPDPREEFLRRGSPRALRNGWVEFVKSDYATRDKCTRVLIHCDDISSVDEGYDLKNYDEREWCAVHLKDGNHYYVKATYDEMKNLLIKRRTYLPTGKEARSECKTK